MLLSSPPSRLANASQASRNAGVLRFRRLRRRRRTTTRTELRPVVAVRGSGKYAEVLSSETAEPSDNIVDAMERCYRGCLG